MSDRDTATDDESSTDREPLADGIERRGVLAALAAGVGGVGLARRSLARELGVDALDAPGYVVEQGDRCVPITPLSGEETAEALYDYRTPDTDPSSYTYSSYGTTDLQRPETSICFLYDGPEGLSLVVVHDKLNDGTSGGAATFDLAFENPDRGAWVVGDDDYDGPTNYDTFTSTAEGWTVDWTWGEGRTDGGVYRPLGDDFAVTVDPAFNEAADLYGDHYEGEITDWQMLSGDRDDPDRFSLALDRPITIRPGTCDGTTTTTRTTTETTTGESTTEAEKTTTEETATEDDSESEGPIAAEVEILPGKVNPRSHGRLPVVVYSTEGFDATTLREVTFGPGRATPAKRVRTDADGDGRADLKLLFRMDDLDIDRDIWELELAARTDAGREVVGTADMELVPWGDDEDDDQDDVDDEDDEEREWDDEDEDDEDEDDEDDRERGDDDDDEEGGGEDEEDDEGEDEDEDGEEDDDENEEERGDDEDEGDDDDDDEDREDGPPHGDGRGNGRGEDDGRGRGNGRGRGRGNGK